MRPALMSARRRRIPVMVTLAVSLVVYFNVFLESRLSLTAGKSKLFFYAQPDSDTEGILVQSKTKPTFQIWLYPPHEDIISKIIQDSGLYEEEETEFVQYVSSMGIDDGDTWAVDIGANVGHHSLYMAALGMNVISFEPSPDTASLLEKSIRENAFDKSIQVIRAAAAESWGTGRLVRHRDSPGMTILQLPDDSSSLPFGVEDVVAERIPVVRPEIIISEIIPEDSAGLLLLKIDAEGQELHAFRGVNLSRFNFQYISFEFFPELLWKAGQTDPIDLLSYIHSFGYSCTTNPKYLSGNYQHLLITMDDYRRWYQTSVEQEYKKSARFHLNMYCRKSDARNQNTI